MCHLYPYKMSNFYGHFFTLICAVLLVGTNFYTRPEYLTIAISDLKFNIPPLIVPRQQQVFLKFQWRVLYTQTPPSGKYMYTYFIISNCDFSFNFLTLVVSEILWLGGGKITSKSPALPGRPQRKKMCTLCEYFTLFNSIFNFNFLALVVSEILGGPRFTLGSPVLPGRRVSRPRLPRADLVW